MLEEPSEFSRKEKESAKDFFARIVEAMHPQPVQPIQPIQAIVQPKIQVQTKPIIIQAPLPPSQPKILYSELQSMNFGKISALILDPKIKVIVCNGADKKIIAKEVLKLEPREIDIQLDTEEIKQIIQQFSQKSKIPVTSVFRAIVANLSIEAIVSEIIGSRFIINKL
jgi:hypothetical protein